MSGQHYILVQSGLFTGLVGHVSWLRSNFSGVYNAPAPGHWVNHVCYDEDRQELNFKKYLRVTVGLCFCILDVWQGRSIFLSFFLFVRVKTLRVASSKFFKGTNPKSTQTGTKLVAKFFLSTSKSQLKYRHLCLTL